MARFLLIIIGLALVYLILRSYLRNLERPGPPSTKTEDMVRCAQCGVHLPRSESLGSNGDFYCCDDHLRLHRK